MDWKHGPAEWARTVFGVFSHRESAEDLAQTTPLTDGFRTRVLLMCRDFFGASQNGGYGDEFWLSTHQKIQYLEGRPMVSSAPSYGSGNTGVIDDLITYLHECADGRFLDFVELIFRSECFWMASAGREDDLVDMLNQFLALDDLPYHVTAFARGPVEYVQFGTITHGTEVTAYPKVVRKDNQLVHNQAVAPALLLLSDPAFRAANEEFLGALEDFRKGDYADSLTKSASAFESVMKVICQRRGWPVKGDTAAPLIKTIVEQSGLDPFFETPLILIATIRNKLSSSHGAGVGTRIAREHVARFAINATASAILLLEEDTR
ncbi:MAG TPA: hypothetical protein VF576_01030 [Rubricoccaceae bacterium]|jgi:hypothetical protein